MSNPAPVDSIIDFLRSLVRIPSRAGEDDLGPVCRCVEDWFERRGIGFHLLQGSADHRLGLYAEVRGHRPGPWTLLDATMDTAPFGDGRSWRFAPTSAHIEDGWLYGRGSADSKAAVAIFSHLLAALDRDRQFAGRIGVLFDCDEHSGSFGGARAFFDHPFGDAPPPRPDAVLIGYPGLDRIVTGGRGFLRCVLSVHGQAAHSGSSRRHGVNAVSRAIEIGHRLESLALPPPAADFSLPPQVTLTGINGGSQGFSQVPDLCEVRVDVRLTPPFSEERARQAIETAVAAVDGRQPAVAPTHIAWHQGWPAYQVPDTNPVVAAMRRACHARLGVDLPTAVVGPSNIGNYLASIGVPALCGFGVRAEGLHAADERIAIETIAPVYDVYRSALLDLHHN